jgi:Ring finger domain/RNA-binding, Nab2-type zinc finger
MSSRTSDLICKFWDKGKCANDRSCRFKHGPHDRRPLQSSKGGASVQAPPASIRAPCRYLAQGYCAQGQRCPFLHSAYSTDEALRRKVAAPVVPLPPVAAATSTVDSAVDTLAESVSAMSVAQHSEAETEWEEPSESDAYFYGAAGNFTDSNGKPSNSKPKAAAWSKVALAGVPAAVLQAEAQADAESRQAYEIKQAQLAARSTAVQPVPPRAVCAYYLQGDCRFGATCRNAHTQPTSSSSDADHGIAQQQQQQQQQRYSDADAAVLEQQEIEQSAAAECAICCEAVTGQFGLLQNCTHAYCYKCISEWRHKGSEVQAQTVRMCPLCRATSYFIVPSARLITDPDRKAAAIEQYKATLAAIPCRYFTAGECQFGSSCFYAHILPNGQRAPVPQLRVRMGAACEREVQSTVQLSSFFH